jgi:hypothetical protein
MCSNEYVDFLRQISKDEITEMMQGNSYKLIKVKRIIVLSRR